MNNNTPILIDGQHAATLLRWNPHGKSLVQSGAHSAWIANERISDPAGHLTANESPAIKRAYAGVMGERLEVRR